MTSPSEDCSSLFVSGSNDVNPDDDNISVSSTIDSEHDPDEEFVVDAVLAERPHEDPTQEGAMQYLIKWENYPLHRSSWEGRDNLSSELYHQWQEQRELEVRGKHIPFDVRVFESARADIERAREGRHMLRNAKRQRLNLPLTGRLLTGHIPPQAHLSNDDPESSDEALEVGVDLGRADNVPSERERSKQTTFKGVPSSKPAQIRKTNQSSASGWQGTAKRPSEQGILRATNAPKPTQAASSMSLANKFAGKRLKATRTIISKPLLQRSSTASATSAQKARKPRTGLKSAMMDPTKTPKFMTNMRQVNMLKKKGRELNDSAPADPSVIPAGYFITPGPPQWSNSGHGSNSQSMSGAGRSDHISEFDVNQPHDLSVPNNDHSNNATISSSIPSAIKPPTGSKKVRIGKTVHFSGVNDTDDLGTTGRPEPPVRRVSLQSYQQRSMLHDLTKQASFGPHTSRNIDVAFQSLPRVTSDWLSHFGEINHVRFETVCTSVDFLSGSSTYDSEAKLASGLLTSSNAPQALAAVASNLASSGMAFYIAYPGYSVLVYPEHSTWAPLLASTSATDLRSDILKYLVFRPRCAGPMHYLDHSILSNDHSMVVNSAALRIRLMKELAAFNYETLLAPSAKGNHVFFLMFHPTEANVFHTLSLWLRACQPDCQIFHNQEAGAWKAFQSETKSAAVILHESVEKNIRSLPGLWGMLKHSAHTFWKFSSSDHGAVLGPLVPDYVGTLQIPNQFGLTQLFPSGRAFLVTPSFAVSQPEHLLAFFELFRKRALVAPCILVACTDFPKYLFDLAMEKAHDSEVFYQRHLSDSKIEDIASEQGLCQKQQEARARAWELIADFSDAKYCGFSSNLEPAEDIRKFVWIDPLIAPDDEQSLLNWYAAWSMTKLDTFRKFYVLGSSAKDNKKANRVLPIPNYLPEVVNDPDNEPDQEGLASIPPQSFEFRSRLFGSDRASDLKPFFDSFQRLVGKSSFWIFFKAISWYNMDMAEQHKDAFPCDYGTYGQWLACFPRFWKKVNTLIGLFYTTEGDWQEAPPAKTGPTQRRPWIGMLRPVDPHLNASNYSGALELLIWDGVARWPAKPQEKHLLPMQRKLVEAVRDELPRNPKYNGYHLQRVWVANFNMEVDADPSCPVDVACKMMEAIVDGKEGRAKYVPPWDELLLKAGWKLLNKAEVARPRFPHIPADDEEPERLIFHPPRGNVLTNSACTNDLYDAALEARRREPGCRLFPYHYKPTLQWFQNLKDEKRLYNHIDVDSWERIWTDLHVN